MKRVICVIFMLMCIIIFSSCSSKDKTSTVDKAPKTITEKLCSVDITKQDVFEQNSAQNGNREYLYCDDWVYFCDFLDNNEFCLYKVGIGAADLTLLDECYASDMKVYKSKLYYWGYDIESDEAGIYAMNLNGSDKIKIADTYSSEFIINNDKIYYTVQKELEFERSIDNNNLYCCDIVGNNIKKILSKPVFHFYIFDDVLMYQDDMDNCSLHLCMIDGTEDMKLNDCISYSPIFDGETIYYSSKKSDDSLEGELRKINLKTFEDVKICDVKDSNTLMLNDNKLYFVNGDDDYRIYRVGIDGKNKELVSHDSVYSVQTFDDGLLYFQRLEQDGIPYIGSAYVCDFDGGSKYQVWDWLYKN